MKVFSHTQCKLGESPLWHPTRQSLFWLDIENQKIFEKKLDSTNPDYDTVWILDVITSTLACKESSLHEIWLVTNLGLALFDLKSGKYSIKARFNLADDFRTNDGHVSPDGEFWIGTMQKNPTGKLGRIYRISKDYRISIITSELFGIPNTFCWSSNGSTLYVSDSLLQKIFAYNFPLDSTNIKKEIFVDLSNHISTPDGAAMDTYNGMWNAQWDGHCIVRYTPNGEEDLRLNLPIPRPTSCCFGGNDNKMLFITSASTGLSQEDMSKFPLSGNTFIVELKEYSGSPTYSF